MRLYYLEFSQICSIHILFSYHSPVVIKVLVSLSLSLIVSTSLAIVHVRLLEAVISCLCHLYTDQTVLLLGLSHKRKKSVIRAT